MPRSSNNIRVAIITNASVLRDSMQRLSKAAQKAGVIFDVVNFNEISLTNFENSAFAQSLLTYDIVYYRTGMRDSTLRLLTNFCEQNNLPIINGVHKYHNAHRKIQQAIICAENSIAHPNSVVVNKASYSELASVLGDTFVCKPDVGSKGNGVVIVNSEQSLDEAKEFATATNKILAQEFIHNADEYRVYTLGGAGITSYKKIAGDSDFRANMHAGGSMEETEPELFDLLNEYAGEVAKAFEADISGLDVLVQNGNFITLELNFQPGWENLKEITSTSFSEKSLEYIVSRAK